MDSQKEENFNERRSVDARIVRLEQVAENLAGSVGKLTTDVGNLAQLMRESNKTNWGVMATWAGVFLMLTVALGNGYVGQPLRDQAQMLSTLGSSFTDHIKDGHPKTVLEKVTAVDEKVNYRETVMRREIGLRQAKRDEQFNTIQSELRDIKKWQYDRDQNRLNKVNRPDIK